MRCHYFDFHFFNYEWCWASFCVLPFEFFLTAYLYSFGLFVLHWFEISWYIEAISSLWYVVNIFTKIIFFSMVFFFCFFKKFSLCISFFFMASGFCIILGKISMSRSFKSISICLSILLLFQFVHLSLVCLLQYQKFG